MHLVKHVLIVAVAGFMTASALAGDNQSSLREAAGKRFLIGTAVMSHQLDDPKLAALVARDFNCLTGENEFKPENLEPRKGEFNFGPADKIVAFAEQHDMKVVGHTLCWHQQTGKWMFQGADGKPLGREEALANLKNHIDNVAKHFHGKVIGWDVVNEAISDGGKDYLRDTPARRAIGDDYIAKAFEFAHAADPDAQLYYNDYANENPEKREKTIRLIRELKSKGLRIDAVGLQCHFMMKYPGAPKVLDQAIKAYAAEGVKVMITELDLDMLPRNQTGADTSAREQGGQNPYEKGLTAEAAKAQTDYYRRVFDVVLKHPGVVTRVTFWGTHDGASWLNNWPTHGRTNHPLLFDRDLKPKPPYDAIVRVLNASPHQ